ncbi:signal peptidase I [Jeotgalibacillus sp. JSM ZJ347]|uniref:signal peptidase I n=1 Tax=Jeotgalibacillus sp. JSM ZJ347 TaxID=3342117 RepID=UPI0035A94A4C
MKKILLLGFALLLSACSSEVASNEMETITDNDTKSEVELVEPLEDTFLVEWKYDNMDRGNHDYHTTYHSPLVVNTNSNDVKRGEVLYYKTPDIVEESNPEFDMPEYYISRVVGLEGETVEIKNGQVFINDKKLDTFYSKALNRGMDREEYFEKVDSDNRGDEDSWKEYFSTNMEPVEVEKNTVFVLGDNWWRSTDSKDFGVLPLENVEGKVLGYEK